MDREEIRGLFSAVQKLLAVPLQFVRLDQDDGGVGGQIVGQLSLALAGPTKHRQLDLFKSFQRALGGHVTDIRRTEFAGLTLGTLPEGHWRILGPGEIHSLRKRVDRALKAKSEQENPGGNRR